MHQCRVPDKIATILRSNWGRLRVENVPDPSIQDARDAIVRVTSTAICGSDLHICDGFIPAMEEGDILGHEFMGVIEEVGNGHGGPHHQPREPSALSEREDGRVDRRRRWLSCVRHKKLA